MMPLGVPVSKSGVVKKYIAAKKIEREHIEYKVRIVGV